MARKAAAKLPAGMIRRPNGLLMCRFTIDGKRYTVYGATKEECREKELQKREEIKAGTYTRSKDLKVKEYFDRWYESRSGVVAPATMRTYKKLSGRMNRQTIDAAGHVFGDIKLKDMETEQIRQLQRALINDGLQTRTVNDSISLLKHALETAVNERIITWNPAKPVERLKRTEEPARNTIHRSLTREETKLFLEAAADSWYYQLYIFLLNTGLRIGEASALTIRDINESYIDVHKTVTRTEIGYTIADQTKTEAGRRKIDTRPEAWEAVKEQRAINEAINSGKITPINRPVFTLPKGGIIRPDRVNSDIKRICDQAGIEYFTCHAFRATFTSRCIAAGVPVKTLMEILGHSDVQMTLGLYGHAEEEQKRQQILAVNL